MRRIIDCQSYHRVNFIRSNECPITSWRFACVWCEMCVWSAVLWFITNPKHTSHLTAFDEEFIFISVNFSPPNNAIKRNRWKREIGPVPSTPVADAGADAVYWHLSFLTRVALGSALHQLNCSRFADSGPRRRKKKKNRARYSELNSTNWVDLILRDELSLSEERQKQDSDWKKEQAKMIRKDDIHWDSDYAFLRWLPVQRHWNSASFPASEIHPPQSLKETTSTG